MAQFISINGIEIELQKKKIKNLHLYVKPGGKVLLTMPHRASKEEALLFARSNIAWIEARRKASREMPSKEYYQAKKAEFDQRVAPLLQKWQKVTHLTCASWHSRYMTSRWGSCIPQKKRLCFNLQLADKPEESLEYVILHELLHLAYAGHGADFKQALTAHMPDWKDRQKALK